MLSDTYRQVSVQRQRGEQPESSVKLPNSRRQVRKRQVEIVLKSKRDHSLLPRAEDDWESGHWLDSITDLEILQLAQWLELVTSLAWTAPLIWRNPSSRIASNISLNSNNKGLQNQIYWESEIWKRVSSVSYSLLNFKWRCMPTLPPSCWSCQLKLKLWTMK